MPVTTEELAEYTLKLEYGNLSDDAIDRTKRVVLDTVGCALGAYTSPPSKVLRSCFEGRGEQATVVGSGGKASTEYATLINSALARYLDYNDTYLRAGRAIHPSDHVLALLAVAEAEGATGKELIKAINVAYEIEGAGRDTGELWGTGHDYVTWGAFSCAAAAGKLMDLNEEELIHAIGIAGTSNITLGIARRGNVSMWKGVAHGYVNHNAVQACLMAKAGMTGPEAVFEGVSGFFEAATDGPFEMGPFGGQEDQPYRVTQTNLKPYPCGYYMQTVVEAALELREKHGITHKEINDILVKSFEHAVKVLAGPKKWDPGLTRESADHSIPYTVSVALVAGEVTPEQYTEEYLRDERVHKVMEKTAVEEDPELTAFVEKHDDALPMNITIETDSGTYQTQIDYPIGHSTKPMTNEQLEGKFSDMALELLTQEQIDRTFNACYDLESLNSVRPLVENLTV